MTAGQQRVAQRPADQPATEDQHAQPRPAPLLVRAWRSGSVASVLSTFAVSVCSRCRSGRAAAGTNAASQWIWYPEARAAARVSLKFTAVGYAIHHASSVFWATGYEALRPQHARLPGRVARAAGIAALAYVVDYHVVPRRLSPGFEHRIGAVGLWSAYAAFAIGLLAATRPATRTTSVPASRLIARPVRPRHPGRTATTVRSPGH